MQDVDRMQQVFSFDRLPTLWQAIPAFERLQSAWEKKTKDKKYALYSPGIDGALEKLLKYYRAMDKTPLFILALCECFAFLLLLVSPLTLFSKSCIHIINSTISEKPGEGQQNSRKSCRGESEERRIGARTLRKSFVRR